MKHTFAYLITLSTVVYSSLLWCKIKHVTGLIKLTRLIWNKSDRTSSSFFLLKSLQNMFKSMMCTGEECYSYNYTILAIIAL